MEEVQETLDRVSRHLDLEEHDEAKEIVDNALKQHGDHPDLLTALARIYARTANDRLAEKKLHQVLRIDPNHEGAVCALGRLLDSMLRIDEAKKLYISYMENNPDKHEVVDDYVRILVSEDKYDEALNIARKHAEDYPNEVDAYKALRNLLFIIENDIRDDYEDSDFESRYLVQLAENLVDQYDTILKIDDNVESKDSELKQDIKEEYLRISGEIESIMEDFEDSKGRLPKGLKKRMKDIIDDCAEKRDF